jgi:putative ABC transport system ATP-binding protein
VLIDARHIKRSYALDGVVIPACNDITLAIEEGEFVAIMGASGSGKSTFMNIVGCLDRPTEGCYLLDSEDTSKLDSNSLAHIRNRKIGFVFQQFNLLERMTSLANVELPLIYGGVARKTRLLRAAKALERVGLGARANHRPNQLSGGQQQRVAVARALVNSPKLLLADEPTGALDSRTSEELIELFKQFNREGMTIVLVTHEFEVAKHAARIIRFQDGRILS